RRGANEPQPPLAMAGDRSLRFTGVHSPRRPPRIAADETEDTILKRGVPWNRDRRCVPPLLALPLPDAGSFGERAPQACDLVAVHRWILSSRPGKIPPVLR